MKRDVLNFYLKVGAKNLNISERLTEFLEKGDAYLKFQIPFEKKKGEIIKIPSEFFYASKVRGPYFGEVHLKEKINSDELISTAFLNVFSNALFDIPFGGICGSIGINDDEYTLWERKVIFHMIMENLTELKSLKNFVILPGRGTGMESLMIFHDELSKADTNNAGRVLGKPPEFFGISDFDDIFSECMVFAIDTMLEDAGEVLKGKKVTFYGIDRYSDALMEKVYSRGVRNFIVSFEDAGFFKVPEEIKSKFLTLSEDEIISYESDVFIISETAKEIDRDKASFLNSQYILELKPFSILPEAEEIISRRNLVLLPDIFAKGILNLIYFEEYLKGMERVKKDDISLNVKRKFIEVYRDTLGISIAKNLSLKKTAYMIALGKIMKLISVKGV